VIEDLIRDTLDAWREGETLLRRLNRRDVEYDAVRSAVVALRDTYERLASTSSATDKVIESCRRTMLSARQTISDAHRR